MFSKNLYMIREIEEKDLEIVLKWRNSERIRCNMYSDHLITMDEHIRWFLRLQQKRDAIYSIFEYKHCPVGVVYLTDLDSKNNKCSWGFYLGEEQLPSGIGSIMGLLGLELAFEKLEFHKVCGEVFAFNLSSINFHKKLGFSQEGYFKQHVLKNSNYEDLVCFGLLRKDWLANKIKLEQAIFTPKGGL